MNIGNNAYYSPPPHSQEMGRIYEELPDWYLKKKVEEEKKAQENPQFEFNIPFGWTE